MSEPYLNNLQPIYRYRIHYQAISDIDWSDYAGSSLRGAFGHALKSVACLTSARHHGVCHCPAEAQCIYQQLFEPKQCNRSQYGTEPIAPYIIETPYKRQLITAGKSHYFDMVLIGEYAKQQQMVIQFAWLKALYTGVGRHNQQGQQGQAQLLNMQLLSQPDREVVTQRQVTLEFETFLRLSRFGKLVRVADFDAQVLLLSLIRRVQEAARLYGVQLPQPNHKQLCLQIEQVTWQAEFIWQDWLRYSNRQRQKMNLGGLLGHIQLNNLSDELYYYLYLGQWLHVGKNAVFGLGQYQLK